MSKFKSNNVVQSPKINWAKRYEAAYNKLFKTLDPKLQERVLQLKQEPDSRDWPANQFIQDVIKLAESEEDLS